MLEIIIKLATQAEKPFLAYLAEMALMENEEPREVTEPFTSRNVA